MEWTENIEDILPEETLFAEIEELPDGARRVVVESGDRRAEG